MSEQQERLRSISWADYEEPTLLSVGRAGVAVLVSRCLLAGWAIASLIVAVRARSSLLDGEDYEIGAARLSLWGIVAAALVALCGWFLSDRTAQDIHLLQARLPSRLRCATAWLMPLLWTLMLAVVVLSFGPTEVFDVRPVIIGVVFAIAVWRPYSLIRRIIRSLIRVDADVLVGAAYVLELASFGVLWWRLETLPDVVTPSDTGVIAALVGLTAVAVVAALLSFGCWVLLLRAIREAINHRRVAMRTRHNHRQLRFFGIDPMDPVVRAAFQRIRREDEAQRVLDENPPPVDSPAEVDRLDAAEAEVDDVAPPAVVEVDEPASKLRSALDAQVLADQVDESEPVDEPAPAMSHRSLVDRIADRLGEGEEDIDEGRDGPVGEVADETSTATERDDQDDDEDEELAVAARLAAATTVAPEPVDDRDIITRLTSRAESLGSQDDDLAALYQRGPSILERLAEHGIAAGGPSIPVDSRPEAAHDAAVDAADLIIDRMYSLETVRYLLLASFLAILAGAAWLLMRSTGVTELIDGEIPVVSIERLDTARRLAISALSVGLAVVPLWCAAAAMWSRRVGVDVAGRVRCLVLFGLVLVLNVVAAAADPGRGGASFLAVLCGLGAALWAIPVMIEIQRQFERSITVTTFLPVTLSFAVASTWIAGFGRRVQPTDSIESMTFLGGLLVLTIAVVVVVTTISTADVVEAIKLSPRMVSERRRKTDSVPARGT